MSDPTPVDDMTGWSTPCRLGDFAMCVSLAYRTCKNPRHKREGETPEQRGQRLLAEARAQRTGDAPPAALPGASGDYVSAEPAAAESKPGVSMQRLMVLAALVRENGGEVTHSGGRATSVLHAASGYEAGLGPFSTLLGRMEDEGLIERETRGTKTFRISITDAGEQLLPPTDDAPSPTAEAERPLKLVPPVEVADPEPEVSGPALGGGRRPSPSATPLDPRDAKVDIVWEEPTRRTTGRHTLTEVLEAQGVFDTLRERPGEWARIVDYGGNDSGSKAVTKLRRDEAIVGFEWTSKRKPLVDGQSQGSLLYGRFVGEDA